MDGRWYIIIAIVVSMIVLLVGVGIWGWSNYSQLQNHAWAIGYNAGYENALTICKHVCNCTGVE
jgi:hypothetical protein